MTWLLLKLGVRFLAFGLIFGIVSHRSQKISIQPKLALPVVALVFALLNTGIYWLAKPVLNIATLGMLALVIPFVLNGVFLYATARLTRLMRIHVELDGTMTMVRMAVLLTAAHGALYLLLDVLPA